MMLIAMMVFNSPRRRLLRRCGVLSTQWTWLSRRGCYCFEFEEKARLAREIERRSFDRDNDVVSGPGCITGQDEKKKIRLSRATVTVECRLGGPKKK